MRILIALCLIVYQSALFAQLRLVEGTVKDKALNPIPNATVQLKSTVRPSDQQYAFSDNQGIYNLKINQVIEMPWFLIASCLGYKRDTLIVGPEYIRSGKIEVHFTLEEDYQVLDQIYITARKAIQVDNDTTSYRVENFMTSDDRNLESVLKKMPGMEVKQDGTLFFKGKKINKVLLDGDDLTGDGYKVLTKNLKPEFVKDVQAIENYVEDILLKGIISSDDIVLNLKMKNPKALFGNVDVGAGNNQRFSVSGNGISYLKKNKTYIASAANNIGQTLSNRFNLMDDDLRLPSLNKVIRHQITANSPFDSDKFFINKSSLISGNAVKMVNDALKLKVNLNLSNDRLFSKTFVENTYFPPNQISIRDQSDNSSWNQTASLNAIGDYLISANSRFWAKIAYTYIPERFNSETLSSFGEEPTDQITQNQNDLSKYFQTELKYTVKANHQLAFIVGSRLVMETIQQDYRPGSLLYSSLTLFNATQLLQLVDKTDHQFELNTELLFRKRFHYINLGLGFNHQQTALKSDLLFRDQTIWTSFSDSFRNNTNVIDKRPYLNTSYTFDDKKLKVQARLLSSEINTHVFDKRNKRFIIQPMLNASLKARDRHNLSLSYKYRNVSTNPFEYYRNSILTDLRATTRGLTDFYNFGTHQASFSYNYNDFIDRYLSLTLSSNASISKQGLIFNSFFEDVFFINQKIPYNGLKNISGSVQIKKFAPLLSTNFSAMYILSGRNYFSVAANYGRKLSGNTHQLIINGDTGFDFPVNLNAQFQILKDATFSQQSLITSNSSYKYSLQTRLKLNLSMLSTTSLDWYQVNKQSYPLLNSEMQIGSQKGAFRFSIEGRNLLDMRSLDSFFSDDVSSSRFSSSAPGRLVLLNLHLSLK